MYTYEFDLTKEGFLFNFFKEIWEAILLHKCIKNNNVFIDNYCTNISIIADKYCIERNENRKLCKNVIDAYINMITAHTTNLKPDEEYTIITNKNSYIYKLFSDIWDAIKKFRVLSETPAEYDALLKHFEYLYCKYNVPQNVDCKFCIDMIMAVVNEYFDKSAEISKGKAVA